MSKLVSLKKKILFFLIVMVGLVAFLVAFEVTNKPITYIQEKIVRKCQENDQIGIASWYDYKLVDELIWDDNGTAILGQIGVPCFHWKEECYTEDKLFAASRKYEKGTHLMVTNVKNSKSVIVTVTDYVEHPERVIDMTSYAFSKIADIGLGLIDVRIEVMD